MALLPAGARQQSHKGTLGQATMPASMAAKRKADNEQWQDPIKVEKVLPALPETPIFASKLFFQGAVRAMARKSSDTALGGGHSRRGDHLGIYSGRAVSE